MKTIPKIIEDFTGARVENSLRLSVTAVFLKPTNKLFWQKKVFSSTDGFENKRHYIKPEFFNAIWNAIVLCYLAGNSGKVRGFFDAHIGNSNSKNTEDVLSLIEKRYEQQFAQFFCLGVVPESLSSVIEKLKDESWQPLTERLPSPFISGNLEPVAILYGDNVPWVDYHRRYSEALVAYEAHELDRAELLLAALEREAALRLPLVSLLLKQVRRRKAQSNDYFDYLQQALADT